MSTKDELEGELGRIDEQRSIVSSEIAKIDEAEATYATRRREALLAGDPQSMVKLEGEREFFEANRATLRRRALDLQVERARLRVAIHRLDIDETMDRYRDAQVRLKAAEKLFQEADAARRAATTRRNAIVQSLNAAEAELEKFDRAFADES
ncbi:MAG: hypothetical protein WAT66_04730 [Actinomycetota bacterium]